MCFFSRRNAQRIAPLSSSRCQNGPLWTSKLSRVQVHQPANSPDVAWTAPSWRVGAFLGTKFTGALQLGRRGMAQLSHVHLSHKWLFAAPTVSLTRPCSG